MNLVNNWQSQEQFCMLVKNKLFGINLVHCEHFSLSSYDIFVCCVKLWSIIFNTISTINYSKLDNADDEAGFKKQNTISADALCMFKDAKMHTREFCILNNLLISD